MSDHDRKVDVILWTGYICPVHVRDSMHQILVKGCVRLPFLREDCSWDEGGYQP